MCLSFVGQIIFAALMVATFALTAASMFSPGWRELRNKTDDVIADLKHLELPKEFGLFPFLCRAPTNNNNYDNADQNSSEFCKKWFENLPNWEKVVVVFMCLALAAEILTLAWTLISCCGCCCKGGCLKVMPPMALTIAALLAAAVTVFGINNKESISIDSISSVVSDVKTRIHTEAGYSFYMACGALAGAIISSIVGWISIFFSKFCC